MFVLAICDSGNIVLHKFDNIEDAKAALVKEYIAACDWCGVEDPWDEDHSHIGILEDRTEAWVDWYYGRFDAKVQEI